MKTWKQIIFMAFIAINVLVFVFIACDDSNGLNTNENNINDNNLTGGTLVVNNGTYSNYTVTITFDSNEVFSGTIAPHETIRKTSNKDVEYKIFFYRQYPYTASKVGSMSGGETVYYNLGE